MRGFSTLGNANNNYSRSIINVHTHSVYITSLFSGTKSEEHPYWESRITKIFTTKILGINFRYEYSLTGKKR